MKYIHLICILTLFLNSCTFEEKDIFSASPAERLNKSITDNFNILTDASNGWVMDYFANPYSAGYTLLVKFKKSGLATVASQSELTKDMQYEQDSCLFEIIGDNGPVLTFNTYNKVLHRFSNPENPDGYGLQGDYEFVILKAENEKVILKGKKNSSIIEMNKLPVNVVWTDYVEQIDNLNSILFLPKSPKLTMSVGKSIYTFTKDKSSICTVVKEGAVSNQTKIPFIVKQNGIKFQTKQNFEGQQLQEFVLNDEKSAFVSVDNADYKISGPADLAVYFVTYVKLWEIDPLNLSSDILSLYNSVVHSCSSTYMAENVKLSIKYHTIRRTFVLSLSFTENGLQKEGNIDLTLNANGKNTLVILKKSTGDDNGLKYNSEVTGLAELATLLSSNFTLSTFAPINPATIKLTKKTDANTWLTLIDK
jgi:hypothetical protein